MRGVLPLLALLACLSSAAELPERVVTLSPHLAEIVYAAGAGDRLAGVTVYTDFPPTAAGLPRIGDAFRLDMERLSVIGPDLVLAWAEGTPAQLVRRLQELDYRVVRIRTGSVAEVAAALRQVGRLLGTPEAGTRAAAEFLAAMDAAVGVRSQQRPLRVFFQIGSRPLYTVNGEHYISELIRLCGGRNVFAELSGLAPVVSVESVLSRDPELILAPGEDAQALARWQQWESLTAARTGNLRFVPADPVVRPTPRLAEGAAAICAAIDRSRRSLTDAEAAHGSAARAAATAPP